MPPGTKLRTNDLHVQNAVDGADTHAMHRRVRPSPIGLAVLLRHGLAVWIEQWSKLPRAPPLEAYKTTRARQLTDDTSQEVVNVLTAMALGQIQEVLQ